MTVLITGGTGFVGLNLVEELVSGGIDVVALGRHPPPPAVIDELRRNPGHLTFAVGDVRDRSFVERVCNEQAVDTIVHAAVITADASRESRMPDEIVSVNVNGTLNILGIARAIACRRVIYVGSGQAYGMTHRDGNILEEDVSPSLPEELYGITKLAAEQIALRLGQLWGLDVVAVRLGTVCGPWEFDTGDRDMLSPQLRLARMAFNGQEAVVPQHEFWRDWVYSRDVAHGLAMVVRAPACAHRLYHLTSGLNWSSPLRRWCEVLRSTYPRFSWRIASDQEAPNVSQIVTRDRSPMSISRIRTDLGFSPKFGLNEAYNNYIGWLRGHEDFVR